MCDFTLNAGLGLGLFLERVYLLEWHQRESRRANPILSSEDPSHLRALDRLTMSLLVQSLTLLFHFFSFHDLPPMP
jgi:hypothetical protein